MGKRKHVIGQKKKQYDHRVNFKSKKPKLSQDANPSSMNNCEIGQALIDYTISTKNDNKNNIGFDEEASKHLDGYVTGNSTEHREASFYESNVSDYPSTRCSEKADTEQVWDSVVGTGNEGTVNINEFALIESNTEEAINLDILSGYLSIDNMCLEIDETKQVCSHAAVIRNEGKVINSGFKSNTEREVNLEQLDISTDYLSTNNILYREEGATKQQCEEEIFSFVYGNNLVNTGNCSNMHLVLNTNSRVKIGDVVDWNAADGNEQMDRFSRNSRMYEDQTSQENYINTQVATENDSINEVFTCGSETSDDSDSNFSGYNEYDWDDSMIDSGEDYEFSKDTTPNFDNDSGCDEPKGNRIVDISFIISQIKEMNSHSVTCNFNDMNLVPGHEELKQGFNSSFKFMCSKCSLIFSLKTSKENEFMSMNYAAVVAAFAIGIGQSQLEEFTAILGVPSMAHSTFETYQNKFLLDIDGATRESMDAAAKEETNHAIEKGNIDSKGRSVTKVYVDGAWNKRSYRTNYSASSGTATLIGHNTKKVIWNDVANKYCVICARIRAQNLDPYEHKCNTNYQGSSTGMEAKLIVKGFKECEERYNLRINEIIADGDSSVISELNKAQIYKYPLLKIKKTDCCGHIFRNVRGSLRKLAKKPKFAPYLTNPKIEEIITGIRCARMHWVKTDLPKSAQIENLRQDILNAPSHVFGSHEKCAEYFCVKKDSKGLNVAKAMKEDNSFKCLHDALSRARLNARSILIYETTNIVEHFNSYIVKHSGNKRINFSKSGSWKGRVQYSVLDHNTKRAYSAICEFINKKPQPLMEKLEFKRMLKNLLELVKERKYKKKRSGDSGPDASYGTDTCERLDLDDMEFELEKKLFLESIEESYWSYLNRNQVTGIENKNNVDEDEADTDLESIQLGLLMSSNFGSVCTARSPSSYHGLVNEILYGESMTQKEIVHQSTYKSHAIQKFEDSERLKVDIGGLFIDQDIHTLAAIVDGFVGTDSIVIIKCPLSTFEIDLERSILAGKLTIWKKQRKRKSDVEFVPKVTGLNDNHKWYYEIQGQLHITQRSWCYLVVWASNDLPLRVEKVKRDDIFWREKMETKLKNFYEKALLLELVDSRSGRSMDLRKFDENFVCIA